MDAENHTPTATAPPCQNPPSPSMSRSSVEDDPGYYSSALHQIREKSSAQPQYSPDDRDLHKRLVENVKPPAAHPPNDHEFYVPDVQAGIHRPNVKVLRDHFFNEGRLTEPQALFILEQTTTLLTQEPNMLQIDGPVTARYSRCCEMLRDAATMNGIQRHPLVQRCLDGNSRATCLFTKHVHDMQLFLPFPSSSSAHD
ncbi:hypothetical protein DAEQUDRAFT_601089 [Daedalea quercina L-15889]|uniref:Uncharacterized protein n=1 Tax=Daedalea quercina L-15889 TaxID=1314783 RepID=A0A165LP11_9APHY|nr:hypothetical protein DAEQUDRAFT_601089 [Daedalea quercina L-15889]